MKPMPRSKGQPTAGPQSVGRIFLILEFLVANREGATLSELASFVGAPKTSLVGLLNAMVNDGGLRREASGRYVLGARIFALAMRAVAGRELSQLARPFLLELVETTGETAVLGTLADDADLVVYQDKVESANPIRYAVTIGERRELHCTALGKVLLAHLPPKRLERFLASGPLPRFTLRTITGAAALRAELQRIRRDGIARTGGERVRDADGLAAPVFQGDGRVVAGLLIAGPSQRMEKNKARNEKALRECSAALTEILGGIDFSETQ